MGASTHLGEKHHTPGGQDATLGAHTSTFQTALKKLSFMPSNALIPTRSITLCVLSETAPTFSKTWPCSLLRHTFLARTLHGMLLEGVDHLFNQRFGLSSLYALQALLEHRYPLPQFF